MSYDTQNSIFGAKPVQWFKVVPKVYTYTRRNKCIPKPIKPCLQRIFLRWDKLLKWVEKDRYGEEKNIPWTLKHYLFAGKQLHQDSVTKCVEKGRDLACR